MLDLRHRFPAITEGTYADWARFDGPAGTQVVDSAIEATAAWQRSGNNANSHGHFAAAEACDALVGRVRETMADLLHAGADG
ncbi:MAG: cysteine desulfurase-like protein, partial [Ilumatobacter sp.]|nr:cysteine desulfurase-like protein [Ilumatobacter sp.]